MTKLKYKVLTKDLESPFRFFQYKIGKEYVCKDFDDSNKECSRGFYATDIEGLIYSINYGKGNKVFEVKVSGKSRIFDQFKQRYEKQTILREVPTKELKKLVRAESRKLDYDLYHAIYPVNPLRGKPKEVTPEIEQLFKNWISVWGSVRNSVRNSVIGSVRNSVRNFVRDSVSGSVGDSVCDSVRDSVRDSIMDYIYAYIGSLFPEIKDWLGIDHEEGIYPFQSGVDLWKKGFVPSFDGTTWRLHSGKDAQIVYTRGKIKGEIK